MLNTTEPLSTTQSLTRAFRLGQKYWQQSDSDSLTENLRASETMNNFNELLENAVLNDDA